MTAALYDLCAIGNALVDIVVPCGDAFLAANGIAKGAMTLVDDDRAAMLYDRAGASVEMSSGGSAGNTMAGFVSLGGKGAYLGKVGADTFGGAFAHDLHAQGVHFSVSRATGLGTGRCLVFVTPDAQRSMCTFLGAATEFGPADVDMETIRGASVTYLEGYLFDKPSAKEAFRLAAKIAHEAGRKLALTLSDVFCVSRHRAEFLALVYDEVDILFANQNELLALYETGDLDAAVAAARGHAEISVTTRSEKGAIVVAGSQTLELSAHPVAHVIDTTGAGDLYAAGFLYGMTQGLDLAEAGRIGAIAASEVISHYGPRPQTSLRGLI
ncbi:MAG: adenosine kinase [Alphaproteobacteria bacterium]|nr:adenosine kinase [Alphaproteobacteria bacterium]